MSFAPEPTFTEHEIALLKKTAEALTAYLGKPVIAEIDTTEDGLNGSPSVYLWILQMKTLKILSHLKWAVPVPDW